MDANFFQHLPYLETEMEENGYERTPFEGIHIEPLGIFSESLTSLDELEEGASVGVPNDPTNRGRALALESGQHNPYANMLVVRTEVAEDEALVALDELLHSEDVRAFIEETCSGAIIPAF